MIISINGVDAGLIIDEIGYAYEEFERKYAEFRRIIKAENKTAKEVQTKIDDVIEALYKLKSYEKYRYSTNKLFEQNEKDFDAKIMRCTTLCNACCNYYYKITGTKNE